MDFTFERPSFIIREDGSLIFHRHRLYLCCYGFDSVCTRSIIKQRMDFFWWSDWYFFLPSPVHVKKSHIFPHIIAQSDRIAYFAPPCAIALHSIPKNPTPARPSFCLWPSFSSASQNRTVAEEFAKGDTGTLFFLQLSLPPALEFRAGFFSRPKARYPPPGRGKSNPAAARSQPTGFFYCPRIYRFLPKRGQ